MGQQVIKGTQKLSETIRKRRLELNLTIAEAALRAGVGMKTWCRYESGESIRKDKVKGICKALNWHMLPNNDDMEKDIIFNISEYKENKAWSEFISDCYGEAAAISFVIGSDILLDYIEEDLYELSVLPKGTHIGQLAASMIKGGLPAQFLIRYDYDFLYCLKVNVIKLRNMAHCNMPFVANSVMQELVLYLIVEEAEFLMDAMSFDMETAGVKKLDTWKDWIYDVLGDMDIVTCLYSDDYLTCDHIYHFEHWKEEQFYT